MAVKRRVNWVSQQRVDTPDMRSIESAASNDFDELMQTLYLGSGEGYIFRGFDILMAGLIGGAASGAQMNVDQAAILHSKSSQSGTFLVVRPGTAPQVLNSATNTIVQGAFSPSSLNYVGIEYVRFIDDTTASQVYIWDPTINDETTKIIPRAQILKYNIVITTGTWANNVLPVCTITTDAGNNVLSIEDNRRLMMRLGTAGRTTPNPFYSYPWTTQPEGRVESPFISSSNATNPFHGGDKMLGTEKDWKDAVMTVLKEIKGSAFWYSAGSSSVGDLNLTDIFFDAVSNVLTMRGKFIHSRVTPGQLTWTGDLHIDSIIGPLRYTIPANTIILNDEQVAYISLVRDQSFQPANTFTFTNGSVSVTGTSLVTGIFAGDWVKFFSDDISKWAQVQSVIGNTITLTSTYQGTTAAGIALRAQGSYTMQIADPLNVPADGNTFWIAKRDDNGAITATIDTAPVGAVRVGGDTTFQTTAAHGINAGENVEVTGVTNTSFNGIYEVLTVPAANQFTVQNTGPDATSGSGTVNSTASIYLRGIGEVSQGESSQDVSSALQALLQYTGSAYAGDTQPQYPSTIFVTQGIDLTTAIGQLDAQSGIASVNGNQDRNIKLVRGDNWAFSNPVLSWSADAFIQVPGIAENRNRIAAGNVTLTNDGDVAYVTINRTAGAPATLAVSVAQISALTPGNNTLIFARKFGAGGVSVGTETGTFALTAPSDIWIDSDKLYITDNGLLKIYDVSSTPNAPTLLGSVAIVNAGPVTVVGNTAYVGGFSGGNGQFKIVDVTTPSAPTISGTLTIGASEIIGHIRVIGTRAFAHTTTGIPAPTDPGDIRIIDVTTPSSPSLLGTNTTYGGNILAGNLDSRSATTHLYKAGGDRVNIFDGTSNSGALLADYMAGFIKADQVTVNATHLFITDNTNNQITIHSLASPTAPSLVATLSVATAPYQTKVLGNLLYVYHSSGNILSLIDITIPASPTVVYSASHVVSNGALYPNDDLVYLLGTTSRIVQAIAAGGTNNVVVGSHSFRLFTGESKELDAGMSIENRTLIGLLSEAQSSPAWATSHSAPLRTIASDSQNMIAATASMDTEIDKFFGQLRLKVPTVNSTRVLITNSDVSMLTGEMRSQSVVNLLLAIDGAQIDFQTGNIYKADGVTALGVNFSPIVPAAGKYRWFSIGVIPSTVNANNTIGGQILVLPASADGNSASLAPRAAFSSGAINLGQVVIFSTNGTTVSAIPQANIISLGVGSGSGGSGSTIRADLYDPISTTLPSGTGATIDGVAVVNGDRVLFSNLGSGNNRIYQVSGVGTSLSWAAQPEFSTPFDPLNGDQVTILLGTGFANQVAMFDGADFSINNIVRHFNVADYWQEESLQTSTLLDATTANIFSVTAVGSENIIIDFSLKRNGIKETGTIFLTNNGSSAFFSVGSAYSGATGIVFSADINAGNVRLRYTASSTGFDTQMKYSIKRWSDGTGGPAGPISYSPSLFRYDNGAFVMSDNSGTPINANPTVNVLGKTRVQMTFTYVVGLMTGSTLGDLEVYANGQRVPRFVAGSTLDMYYKEISNNTIEFYTDLQVSPINIEIVKRV